jgi:translation initiation factor eIF-2B subunit delta
VATPHSAFFRTQSIHTVSSGIKSPIQAVFPEENNCLVERAVGMSTSDQITSSGTNAPEQVPANPTPPSNGAAKPAPAAGDAPKLSNAELKKQAKAEKAARRAQAQQEKTGGAVPNAAHSGRVEGQPVGQKNPQKGHQQQGKDVGKGQHKQRSGSMVAETRQIPIRGQQNTPAPPAEPKKENKKVALFGHLYGRTRTTTLAGISKEVHPSVQATGLQMSNYEICGSNARFVATLQSLKRVRIHIKFRRSENINHT